MKADYIDSCTHVQCTLGHGTFCMGRPWNDVRDIVYANLGQWIRMNWHFLQSTSQ